MKPEKYQTAMDRIKAQELKVGNMVRCKVGDRMMVVSAIDRDRDRVICCHWFIDSHLQENWFAEQELDFIGN